jgi:hypothetical protein
MALNATSSTIMSIDGTGVSEYVVGDGPLSSAAGPSTDPLENLTHCPLQPMGVVVGASADAADADKEQLPEDEDPVVVPFKGDGRERRAT